MKGARTGLGGDGRADIAICIVNWNRKDYLRACLTSLLGVQWAIDCEILVVDNGSTDGSAELVRTQFPAVRLIQNTTNLGFAKASNQAIKQNNSRYILLLNNDTRVDDNGLERMVHFMDAHPAAAVLGCRLRFAGGRLQRSAHHFLTVGSIVTDALFLNRLFPWTRTFGRTNMTYWGHDEVKDVDWLTGAALLVRRAAIHQIGLLDENLEAFGEDLDWCYRFKKANWRVVFFPGAEVVHFHGASSSRFAGENAEEIRARTVMMAANGMVYFFEKHRGRRAARRAWRGIRLMGLTRGLAYTVRATLGHDPGARGTGRGWFRVLRLNYESFLDLRGRGMGLAGLKTGGAPVQPPNLRGVCDREV